MYFMADFARTIGAKDKSKRKSNLGRNLLIGAGLSGLALASLKAEPLLRKVLTKSKKVVKPSSVDTPISPPPLKDNFTPRDPIKWEPLDLSGFDKTNDYKAFKKKIEDDIEANRPFKKPTPSLNGINARKGMKKAVGEGRRFNIIKRVKKNKEVRNKYMKVKTYDGNSYIARYSYMSDL